MNEVLGESVRSAYAASVELGAKREVRTQIA